MSKPLDREGFLEKWTTGVNERDAEVRARVASDLDALLAAERENVLKEYGLVKRK